MSKVRKFSIIIPTYNSEDVLKAAISSIVTQSFLDFEVLIIDGLSQDNTLQIANSFEDPRIRIFSERDAGIYDAMNKGVKYASGEWLIFLGSDDELFDNDVLKDIVNVIHQGPSKFIYGNVMLVGSTSWGEDGHIYNGAYDIRKLFRTNISHQAIFYHRSVFEQCGGYNLKYKICADYDFNLRAAARFEIQYVDRIIAKFNAGGASTSDRDLTFQLDFYDNIFSYYSKNLTSDGLKSIDYQFISQGTKKIRDREIIQGLRIIGFGILFKIQKLFKS